MGQGPILTTKYPIDEKLANKMLDFHLDQADTHINKLRANSKRLDEVLRFNEVLNNENR